jgi:hypothetical protein
MQLPTYDTGEFPNELEVSAPRYRSWPAKLVQPGFQGQEMSRSIMVNVRKVGPTFPTREKQSEYTIRRRYRHWEVRDPSGNLVCLTVYKCGAEEVVRRLCVSRNAR